MKIAFICGEISPFIRQDLDILRRHFEVTVCQPPYDTLRLLQTVKESDTVYIWFAGLHCIRPGVFARLFQKKTYIVCGGTSCLDLYRYEKDGQIVPQKYPAIALRFCDTALPFSDHSRAILEKYRGPKAIRRVYMGVDVDRFTPNGEKMDQVCTVAYNLDEKYIYRKGIAAFIGAAMALPDIPFVIVGDGDRRPRMEKMAPKNVRFAGKVSDADLLRIYQESSVYCQLSIHEGFGVALAEAMACGCVPVTTANGSLPEVAGNTGLYVPYGDSLQTARAVCKAIRMDAAPAAQRIRDLFPLQRRETELIALLRGDAR